MSESQSDVLKALINGAKATKEEIAARKPAMQARLEEKGKGDTLLPGELAKRVGQEDAKVTQWLMNQRPMGSAHVDAVADALELDAQGIAPLAAAAEKFRTQVKTAEQAAAAKEQQQREFQNARKALGSLIEGLRKITKPTDAERAARRPALKDSPGLLRAELATRMGVATDVIAAMEEQGIVDGKNLPALGAALDFISSGQKEQFLEAVQGIAGAGQGAVARVQARRAAGGEQAR